MNVANYELQPEYRWMQAHTVNLSREDRWKPVIEDGLRLWTFDEIESELAQPVFMAHPPDVRNYPRACAALKGL